MEQLIICKSKINPKNLKRCSTSKKNRNFNTGKLHKREYKIRIKET